MLHRGRRSRGGYRGRRGEGVDITYSYASRAAASAEQFFNKFYAIFRLRVS